MSLLLPVLLKTACPTTHRKLALDALRLLRGTAADAWRDLFLRFHKRLLAGAAAPDEELQDFGNHVHYVGRRRFGGAAAAARQAFDQLTAALRECRWSDAAWSAGLLSHYVSDPFLPLNTAQREVGNLVQPGVEWCVNRSYGQLQTILEEDFGGYPAVETGGEEDAVERLIERGAKLAAAHYQTLIDHFDPARTLLDPEEALDQELQDRLALCLGAAVAGVARLWELAIEQAAAEPPQQDNRSGGLIASLKSPLRLLECHTRDQIVQRQLEELRDEFELTGRVLETLPKEQQEIRRLHAEAVLPSSEEPAAGSEPLAAPGKLYGQGAPPRYRPNRLRTAPAAVRTTSRASALAGLATLSPSPGPLAAADAAGDDAPAILKFLPRISRSSPIEDLPCLTAKVAARLRAAAVDTVGDLLAADPIFLAQRLRLRGNGPQLVMDWQAAAQPPELAGQAPPEVPRRLRAA